MCVKAVHAHVSGQKCQVLHPAMPFLGLKAVHHQGDDC